MISSTAGDDISRSNSSKRGVVTGGGGRALHLRGYPSKLHPVTAKKRLNLQEKKKKILEQCSDVSGEISLFLKLFLNEQYVDELRNSIIDDPAIMNSLIIDHSQGYKDGDDVLTIPLNRALPPTSTSLIQDDSFCITDTDTHTPVPTGTRVVGGFNSDRGIISNRNKPCCGDSSCPGRVETSITDVTETSVSPDRVTVTRESRKVSFPYPPPLVSDIPPLPALHYAGDNSDAALHVSRPYCNMQYEPQQRINLTSNPTNPIKKQLNNNHNHPVSISGCYSNHPTETSSRDDPPQSSSSRYYTNRSISSSSSHTSASSTLRLQPYTGTINDPSVSFIQSLSQQYHQSTEYMIRVHVEVLEGKDLHLPGSSAPPNCYVRASFFGCDVVTDVYPISSTPQWMFQDDIVVSSADINDVSNNTPGKH